VPDDSVAKLLRRLRQEKGRSLRTAARDLGVDPSFLSRVESGTRSASEDLEVRISDYYDLDRDILDLAAGRAPADIVDIIRRHPELVNELRDTYGS
jgi:transcriptional regulator with XRE-family HTH domain